MWQVSPLHFYYKWSYLLFSDSLTRATFFQNLFDHWGKWASLHYHFTQPLDSSHRNLTLSHAFFVVPGCHIPLLGRDSLSSLGATIALGAFAMEDNEPSLICLVANLTSHPEPGNNNISEFVLFKSTLRHWKLEYQAGHQIYPLSRYL